ncbi:thioesterase II family protein [Desmospora profundinema]|uniref:Medium-chain acyl-[acyl-carrier-protein] hydrolase n=1 Tax=Desmospora profundinema TaxID=1571184 RepID=A0ABU1IJK1_9BACL|nr:thioesterase domain-containing protein [Desmospora profundinema]MDR6224174.1 medium-chain acyl-[acyl-carrier-protein] hydrolase [Desmospora profundinema]
MTVGLNHGMGAPWVAYRQTPMVPPLLRLYCFPYAGGGASVFREWFSHVPAAVEVCPIQLPGRETRIGELPLQSVSAIVEQLNRELDPGDDVPYAFFGHSLGAVLAYEWTRLLEQQGRPPVRLFVSARSAPHLPQSSEPVHALPEERFVARLRQLNGTPAPILENRELIEFFMPILRADFAVSETYQHRAGRPLTTPISAMGGREDQEVSLEDLEAWSGHTDAHFSLRLFPGDHFYLHDQRELLIRFIWEELHNENVLVRDPG